MEITKVRHSWQEPESFSLFRPNGYPQWSFVHFISSGVLCIDGERVTVPPHTCIIYAPDSVQSFAAPGKPLVHDWMHFTGVTEEWFSSFGLPVDRVFYPNRNDFITDAVFEIELEYFAKRPLHQEILSRKGEELFLRLARTLQEESAPIYESMALRLKELRRKVFSEMQHHWTIDEMAQIVYCSPSRLYALYRAYYGTSPMEDLIRGRIDSAKEQLRFSQKAVSEIAYCLGYENPTHFSRQFRKNVGMSPQQYRRKLTDG